MAEDGGDVGFGTHVADAELERLDGAEVVGAGVCLVDAGGVEVADLLLVGGAVRAGSAIGFEDGVEDLAIPHAENGAGAPEDLVGGDGAGGVEFAAGVLVEVVAWVGGGVHEADIDVGEGDGCGHLRGLGCGGLREGGGGRRKGETQGEGGQFHAR